MQSIVVVNDKKKTSTRDNTAATYYRETKMDLKAFRGRIRSWGRGQKSARIPARFRYFFMR